jgi:hypothetical protein
LFGGAGALAATKMGCGLANDVAADGITCNADFPSLTNTPTTADVPEEARRFVWQDQAIK